MFLRSTCHNFSWLNSSSVVMKTSIWLIFVGQILDCPCRTTKKKLRWHSLLMVAFNHRSFWGHEINLLEGLKPWFHPIKWVIYFILRFQTCLQRCCRKFMGSSKVQKEPHFRGEVDTPSQPSSDLTQPWHRHSCGQRELESNRFPDGTPMPAGLWSKTSTERRLTHVCKE